MKKIPVCGKDKVLARFPRVGDAGTIIEWTERAGRVWSQPCTIIKVEDNRHMKRPVMVTVQFDKHVRGGFYEPGTERMMFIWAQKGGSLMRATSSFCGGYRLVLALGRRDF